MLAIVVKMTERDKIIAYAMATTVYTNGICPFCRVKIAKGQSIKLSDVEEHIKNKKEYPLWLKSYKRSFHW